MLSVYRDTAGIVLYKESSKARFPASIFWLL